MRYKTAQAWREAAMQRHQGVDDKEVEVRRLKAFKHIEKSGVSVTRDVWDDYMLYILGKMELDEYQSYLLFKHSGK